MDRDRLFKLERLLAKEYGEKITVNPLSLWTSEKEKNKKPIKYKNKKFTPRFSYRNCPRCGKTCFSPNDRAHLSFHKKCGLCHIIED